MEISVTLTEQQAAMMVDWCETLVEIGDKTTASVANQIIDKIKEQW